MDDEQLKRLVLKFVRTLFEGKISDAEKMLMNLKKKAKTDEDKRVYLALYGIYFSYTSEDADSLIFKLYSNEDPASQANGYLKMIKETSQPVLGEHDPYVDVWKIILSNVDKIPTPHKLKQQESSNANATQ
jgi:hypothetical protein